MSSSEPILWQLEISHYSEKVRWALVHKGVTHRRRSLLPGMHIPFALWLTRGASKTLPILQLDGRTIADSTAILAALEERYPERALYPADPAQRHRALELEDFFDEEVGPHTRLLAFHELIGEPAVFAEVASAAVPGPLGKAKGLIGAYGRVYTSLRWGADEAAAAETARVEIAAAFDRIEAELAASGGDFLVGDSLSVADITGASLLYPLVEPKEGPLPTGTPAPRAFADFRASLADRRGFQWVEEMFRRHRPADRPAAADASR
jgi:glutathione S-transferase